MKYTSPLITLIFLLSFSHAWALSDTEFQLIGSRYNVSPYLLKAISVIESQEGTFTGRYEVRKVVNETQRKFLRKIARHTKRPLAEFKGSSNGAMGYMQIIPSTFFMYGQDGDNDGIKDPLNPHDSLATAAYFMARTLALRDNTKAALRKYNNSSLYCSMVYALYKKLELQQTFVLKQE